MVSGLFNQVIIFILCNYFLITSVVPFPLQESAYLSTTKNSRQPNNEVQNTTKTLRNSWGDEIGSSESKISHAIVLTILNPDHVPNSSDTAAQNLIALNATAEKDGNNTNENQNTDPNKKFFGLINVHLNNIIQINSKVNWTQENVAYNINLLTHDSDRPNINLPGFTSNYQNTQNNMGAGGAPSSSSSDSVSSDGQRGHSEKGNSGGTNGSGHVGYSLNIGNQGQDEGTGSDDLALPFDIQIPELQSMDDWIMKKNDAN